MKPGIFFFGTSDFSLPSLQALIDSGADIHGVVTKPDAPSGRNRQLLAPAVKTLAQAHHIQVFQPARVTELASMLARYQPSAAVVVSYGKIIPQSIIDLFPLGMINVHASLLPRWRGASPIESAILYGDTRTGVALMRIAAGLDTGPVYSSTHLKLSGNETKPALFERLAGMGAELLALHLDAILNGTLQPTPQDDAKATTCKTISKTDGTIDWQLSAVHIERQIRAYLGWPGSRARLCDSDVTITEARVPTTPGGTATTTPGTALKTPTGELAVTTGDGLLIIDRLIPAGKKEMPGKSFLAGRQL